jgi:hypothetical protein
MIRRTLLQLGAVLLMALGAFLTGWGPLILPSLGIPPLPLPDPQAPQAIGLWKVIAFIRLFGAAVLGLGLVVWALRGVEDGVALRRVARGMAIATGLILGTILIQQVAVWSTWPGVALAAFFALMTMLYGLASLGRRAAGPEPRTVEPAPQTSEPQLGRPRPLDELAE